MPASVQWQWQDSACPSRGGGSFVWDISTQASSCAVRQSSSCLLGEAVLVAHSSRPPAPPSCSALLLRPSTWTRLCLVPLLIILGGQGYIWVLQKQSQVSGFPQTRRAPPPPCTSVQVHQGEPTVPSPGADSILVQTFVWSPQSGLTPRPPAHPGILRRSTGPPRPAV
jgi:hypothetical protein